MPSAQGNANPPHPYSAVGYAHVSRSPGTARRKKSKAGWTPPPQILDAFYELMATDPANLPKAEDILTSQVCDLFLTTGCRPSDVSRVTAAHAEGSGCPWPRLKDCRNPFRIRVRVVGG